MTFTAEPRSADPDVEGALTIEDLEAMPDDGRRYELIGGAIVMTPSPALGHQRGSRRLQGLLETAWPSMEVFNAPVDLDLPGGQRVMPDLVVVERSWWSHDVRAFSAAPQCPGSR